MIGKTVGNYKIIKEIGEGGMGTVYLAEHVTLGKKYALKVLFPHLAKKRDLRERFIREAQAQAALKHANIVSTVDYIEYKGDCIIVTEYIEGENLADLINRRRKPFSPTEILKILEGSLNALNYVHSKGIIHRDLKPSNILLNKDKTGYITDFGIALILGMDRMTRTGTGMGTPHYMSPEQIKNPKNIDHRSDIYSLGCILYEMATGEVPFEGETDYEIKEKHVKDTPRNALVLNPHIPPQFAAAIMKTLSKNPDARFSGCGEMLLALKKVNSGKRPAKSQAIEKPDRKHDIDTVKSRPSSSVSSNISLFAEKGIVAIVAGVVVMLIIIFAVISSQNKKEKDLQARLAMEQSKAEQLAEKTQRNDAEKALLEREENERLRNAEKEIRSEQFIEEERSTEEEKARLELDDAKRRRKAAEQSRAEHITEENQKTESEKALLERDEAERRRREESQIYFNMVRIPSGNFEMGYEDGDSDEKPVHKVFISEFWMDKYEVTNGQYKKCVDAGSCRSLESNKSYTRRSYYDDSRFENYPVILVTWDDAHKYCEWKAKRLPTEAEWEYAARGSLIGVKYPWGDLIKSSDANYRNSRDSEDTTPVGSYSANGYGLYDMAGNVSEWVNDWYAENYYKDSPPQYNPPGPSSGTSRVVRGGSCNGSKLSLRVSFRNRRNPTSWDYYVGFRCAK